MVSYRARVLCSIPRLQRGDTEQMAFVRRNGMERNETPSLGLGTPSFDLGISGLGLEASNPNPRLGEPEPRLGIPAACGSRMLPFILVIINRG